MRRKSRPRINLPLVVTTLLMLSAVTGCEDVIQVDLEISDPQLVIEGFLAVNGLIAPYFRVTRSADFFETNSIEAVDDAQIIVTDDMGHIYSVHYQSNGVYRFSSFYLIPPGHHYHAKVEVGDRSYEAMTTIPARIRIDSIAAEYQKGGGLGTGEDEGYRLHVFFTDPPGTHEHARIILRTDGRLLSDAYYLYDGKFSDGKAVDYNYFLEVYSPGDFANVELLAMDKSTYDYFSTLREVVAWDAPSNAFDVSPANPNTNWSNGALGYFGAFFSDIRSMEIPDTAIGGSPADSSSSHQGLR